MSSRLEQVLLLQTTCKPPASFSSTYLYNPYQTKNHLFMKKYSFEMLKPILAKLYAILRVEEPRRHQDPFKNLGYHRHESH